MKPKLSILIPTINRAHYVKYTLQSCLNLESEHVEILISENHGTDTTYYQLSKIKDKRVTVMRPPRALAMHENFEFLLQQASGEWITFLGDDDAILPHAIQYLDRISRRYPYLEAICSERSYYTWPNYNQDGDHSATSFQIFGYEQTRDSKQQLTSCRIGSFTYIDLPGLYSGGFLKKTLVDRIITLQGGKFFRHTIPDAYGALMAVLHTFRYLETGIPLTVVGTSPVRNRQETGFHKNRIEEFYGRFEVQNQFSSSGLLGPGGPVQFVHWPFQMFFLDTYIAAAPFTSLEWMSRENIYQVYLHSMKILISNRRFDCARILSQSLGFPVPSSGELERTHLGSGRACRDKLRHTEHLCNEPKNSNILNAVDLMSPICKKYIEEIAAND